MKRQFVPPQPTAIIKIKKAADRLLKGGKPLSNRQAKHLGKRLARQTGKLP